MPKFQVSILEVTAVNIEVEAADDDAAQSAANDILESGCMPDGSPLPEAVYYDTKDYVDWPTFPVYE